MNMISRNRNRLPLMARACALIESHTERKPRVDYIDAEIIEIPSATRLWYQKYQPKIRIATLLVLTCFLIFTLVRNEYIGWKEERIAQEQEAQRIADKAYAMLNTEPLPPEIPAQYVEEAEMLAKVIYGIRENSANDMITHIWCIFNRVDIKTGEFAKVKTLAEAVSKPGQWIFFETDYDYPVVESLYQIALAQVKTWHEGHRPCSSDFVYEEWSSKEIVLRTNWEYDKNTKTWRYGE